MRQLLAGDLAHEPPGVEGERALPHACKLRALPCRSWRGRMGRDVHRAAAPAGPGARRGDQQDRWRAPDGQS